MTVRSIPRYPEVREDGSMWVPLAPPPAPTYRPLTPRDREVIGLRAVVSYATEWLLDLRVVTAPYSEGRDRSRHVVELCDEAAWLDLKRQGFSPPADKRLVCSVGLVFIVQWPGEVLATGLGSQIDC